MLQDLDVSLSLPLENGHVSYGRMTLATRSDSLMVLLATCLQHEVSLLLIFNKDVDTGTSGVFKPHPITHTLCFQATSYDSYTQSYMLNANL